MKCLVYQILQNPWAQFCCSPIRVNTKNVDRKMTSSSSCQIICEMDKAFIKCIVYARICGSSVSIINGHQDLEVDSNPRPYFAVLFAGDRSRTMPSRIETRSVAGSYAGPTRCLHILPKVTNIWLHIFVFTNICNLLILHICNFLST
jgi:hypothetical protein